MSGYNEENGDGMPVYATPEEAEAAFYAAFQYADIDAMMGVWDAGNAIICIHPMGMALRGRAAVEASWRQIFEGGGKLLFELECASRYRDERLAAHCVHENIRYGAQFDQRSLVIATNVYTLTENGWRMVLHHGSPGVVATVSDETRALH